MSANRGSNPVWFFVDLTAHAFDDTFYMFVLQNEIPYLPATVWHDAEEMIPWTNPIQFLANGTLPVDIYFDGGTPADPILYRLEFRQGPTQNDPLIYEINNYSPGFGSGGNITSVDLSTSNQITNPQFAITNFNLTDTVSGTDPATLQFAPGWFLDLTGTGTATLTQVPLNNSPGTLTPTNAPYALRLQLTGWTTASLTQRFEQNGMLWANKTVAASFTARVQTLNVTLIARLVDSNSSTIANLSNPSIVVTSSFTEFPRFAKLGATTNPDLPPAAYIDYVITLPGTVDIYLTSFQLIAQDLAMNVTYQQDSVNRQIDHTFNAYKDPIFFKPIPSYLVGWDFPLNPALANGTSGTRSVAAPSVANDYTWDQTILFQSTVSRIATTESANKSMVLTNTGGATQLALIQYLPKNLARSILTNSLSVNVSGDGTQPNLVGTVSLWYSTNAAVPTLPLSLITALDANGKPSTVAAGWFEVPRNPAFGTAQFTLNSTLQSTGFSGWDQTEGTSIPDNATFFAIVVGTASLNDGTAISFNSISLVPGDIPTQPAPQTLDEVIQECQYYYEKSYPVFQKPGQSSSDGALTAEMLIVSGAGGNSALVSRQFSIRFNTQKRSSSGICTLYAIGGTASNVTGNIYNNGAPAAGGTGDIAVAGNWSGNVGATGVMFTAANITQLLTSSVPVAGTDEAFIDFHFTLDDRLGVVV